MLLLTTTVKNKKRRHIRLSHIEGYDIFDDYIYHDELEEKVLKWSKKYNTIILTNDIDIIKIMRDNEFNYYDID